MEKRNKGLGKRITAFTLAAILLATSTDYSVFADEIQAENTETVDDTQSEAVESNTENEDSIATEQEAKKVSEWHWNDDNEILVDGNLDIAYSGDEGDVLTWGEVKDALPQTITGMVDGTEQTIAIEKWNCKETALEDDSNLFVLGMDMITLEAILSNGYSADGTDIVIRISMPETTASNVKYEPMTVSSGYNADIVATSSTSSNSEGYQYTAKMDQTSSSGTKGACLYSSGASSTAGYLPSNKLILNYS